MSFGQFDAGTDKTQFSAISFLIEQAMLKMQTVTLVKVIAVHSNGVGITGTVDVQPMVNQMQAGSNGTQTAIAHGTIYGVPFFRLQGGVSAFICDPVAGDIGLCGFAARDISSVKNTRAVANPGSQRTYDWADGLYVGGFINGVPTQYIQALASAGGWKIVTPGDITLDSPLTEVTGDLKVDGDTTLEGDATISGATTMTGALTGTSASFSGTMVALSYGGAGGAPPTGATGPAGPAFLDVTGPGGFSLSGVTSAAFAGACTVTGSGTSVTITISPGGSITDVTGSSAITVTNGTGPTVSLDLSTAFKAATAAVAAVAASALQPKTGLGGSYTNANLTIDSDGQITAVSNGTGGGGSESFSDGTNTVSGVTGVTIVNGAVVGGTTPSVILTYAWSIDTPSVSPNAMDDEFNGATLNSKWSLFNGSGTGVTATVANSAVTVTLPPDGGVPTRTFRGISQPLPAAPWAFEIKLREISITQTYNSVGFVIANSGTLAACSWTEMWHSSYGEPCFYDGYTSNYTGHSVNDGPHVGANVLVPFGNTGPNPIQSNYLQMAFDGTTYTLSCCFDGINFVPVLSASASSLGVTSPDTIILGGECLNASQQAQLVIDWFRRTL